MLGLVTSFLAQALTGLHLFNKGTHLGKVLLGEQHLALWNPDLGR
jgi:hypothetical protein